MTKDKITETAVKYMKDLLERIPVYQGFGLEVIDTHGYKEVAIRVYIEMLKTGIFYNSSIQLQPDITLEVLKKQCKDFIINFLYDLILLTFKDL